MKSHLVNIVPFLAGLFFASLALGQDDAPRSLDPRVAVNLFAQQPQIVTPTGIDVDHLGRVWVIESHTHFRPDNYAGHTSDRLLVMSDTDADGRADKIVTFTDGLTHAMSVAVSPSWLVSAKPVGDQGPAVISVYVATRKEIFLLHDDDGDLQADRKQRIVLLDTPGTYPHNGLAGLAFDPVGRLVFGLGENLGEKYQIIGSDRSTMSGGGEGGNVYRCERDGSRLQQLATGFWNPHASCFDAFGRLFTVDNDPDALPPCRLIHIIPGGDYGYRFRFGRKGLHPFTCWNGEIPGRLPMVAGTGEAPSGLLAYESDGLPEDYVGNLLATSWGDHRIDRFRLQPAGASFASLAEPVIVGGENYRPVGIACAPDGSLYCSDWVLSDYHLHGRGRVWRISAVDAPQRTVVDAVTITDRRPLKKLAAWLQSPRTDVRRAAATAMAQQADGAKQLLDILRQSTPGRGAAASKRVRVEALWALHRQASGADQRTVDQRASAQRLAMHGPYDEVATAAHRLGHTRMNPVDAAPAARSPSPVPPQELLALVTERSPADTGSVPAGGARQPILDASLPLAAVSNLRFETYLDAGPFLRAKDPFVFATVVNRVSRDYRDLADLRTRLAKANHSPDDGPSPRQRLGWLLAMWRRDSRDTSFLKTFLADREPAVRRAAVQWVGEERFEAFRPQVEAILNDHQITTDLFLAVLATLELLDGKNPVEFDKTPAGKYVLPLVRNTARPAAVRAAALRLVAPDDPALNGDLLASLLSSADATLRLEAVRTLQHSPLPERGELLCGVAADEQADVTPRAAAVLGLAGTAVATNAGDATRVLLCKLMHHENGALRTESVRSLRQVAASDAELRKELNADVKRLETRSALTPANIECAEQLALALAGKDGQPAPILSGLRSTRPQDADSWHTALQSPGGDPAAGRRVFFHANSAGCYKCHTDNGRGGRVGPELSAIGRTLNRRRLVASILNPD
jgi:putative membrane-bound dehydrogenase-like protein